MGIKKSFHGYVKNFEDALILFEAARRNQVSQIQLRPNFSEKMEIGSGTTFIYNETLAGIKRWTDGKSWSSSRLVNGFFYYNQICLSPDRLGFESALNDVYSTEPCSLHKKTCSVINPEGQKMHLVNYFYPNEVELNTLPTPSQLNLINQFEVPNLLNIFKHKFNSNVIKSSPPLIISKRRLLDPSFNCITHETDFMLASLSKITPSSDNRILDRRRSVSLSLQTNPKKDNRLSLTSNTSALSEEDKRQLGLLKPFI